MVDINKIINNSLTLNDVDDIIQSSLKSYNSLLTIDVSNKKLVNSAIRFLSDDSYDFDTLSKYANYMIVNNIDSNMWSSVISKISLHNSNIMNNTKIYDSISKINTTLQKNTNDSIFLDKIIASYHKNGIGVDKLHCQKLTKLSKIINNLELSLCKNDNVPNVTVKVSDMYLVPPEFLEYVSKDNIVVPLNKFNYSLCTKYVKKSSIREKIDDIMFSHLSKNIPDLTYLFINRYERSKLLGHTNYLQSITHRSSSDIYSGLTEIISRLNDYCGSELEMILALKKKFENSSIVNSWDINYYINIWKQLYGVDEKIFSQYFELSNVIKKIMCLFCSIFKLRYNIEKYKNTKFVNAQIISVYDNDILIGKILFDPFKNKTTRNCIFNSVCISNKCFYGKHNILTTSFVILSSDLEDKTKFLSSSELVNLFNEFGKSIYYLMSQSTHSIFGGMYTNIENVLTFGKFFELFYMDKKNLQFISQNTTNNLVIDITVLDKLITSRKLDYGITYNYQCMCGLYDLFTFSQDSFIDISREIITTNNNDKIIFLMNDIFNKIYEKVFSTNTISISKKNNHFHPIMWSHLFSGCGDINFSKTFSDIYAYDLIKCHSMSENKKTFYESLKTSIISEKNISIDVLPLFLQKNIPIDSMFDFFGINIDMTSIYESGVIKKTSNKKNIVDESERALEEDIKKIMVK